MSGIIHGDIKPQNVLLFRNISGGHTAKVADFGYSSKYAAPSDLIYMPRSWPWAAPEWHHRGFTAAQATKMDTYSFGMLVLWVLFYSAEDDSDIRFLRGLRAATGALALANQLIESKSQPKSIDLLQFFNMTLTCDVAFRCSDFKFLIHLLAPEKSAGDPLVQSSTDNQQDRGPPHYRATFCQPRRDECSFSGNYSLRFCKLI